MFIAISPAEAFTERVFAPMLAAFELFSVYLGHAARALRGVGVFAVEIDFFRLYRLNP
jgi:hypothetical protein